MTAVVECSETKEAEGVILMFRRTGPACVVLMFFPAS